MENSYFSFDKRGQTKWKHARDDEMDTDLARHCSLPVIPFNPDVLRSRIIPDKLSGIESSCPRCLRPATSKVLKAVWHIMSSHHRWDLTLFPQHHFTPIYMIIQKGPERGSHPPATPVVPLPLPSTHIYHPLRPTLTPNLPVYTVSDSISVISAVSGAGFSVYLGDIYDISRSFSLSMLEHGRAEECIPWQPH